MLYQVKEYIIFNASINDYLQITASVIQIIPICIFTWISLIRHFRKIRLISNHLITKQLIDINK